LPGDLGSDELSTNLSERESEIPFPAWHEEILRERENNGEVAIDWEILKETLRKALQ
jgi:hypothetical protein